MWNEGAANCHYAIWIFFEAERKSSCRRRGGTRAESPAANGLKKNRSSGIPYEFPLMAAVEKGYKDGVGEELLRVAPEMARETVRGVTPLMSVCRSKSPNVDIVRLLLNTAREMAHGQMETES